MRQLGLEVETFGRPADAKHYDCELVLSGRHLQYTVRLDHQWILFGIALLDRGDLPETLLSVGDNGENWQDICRLIAAMERSGLRSLQRPIEFGGGTGPNGFVIA